ncbi:hypothetical protein SLS61_008603 [Didymella pomorum]
MIKRGDDTCPVHKVIVCCRSTTFAKAINFPGNEAEEKTIKSPDNEPAAIKLLCRFTCAPWVCEICYYLVEGEADQLVVHAKMYEIADNYDVAGLKNLCIEKNKRACFKSWDDPKFAESAHHVYCTTPSRDKGLRKIVTKTSSSHMSLLE